MYTNLDLFALLMDLTSKFQKLEVNCSTDLGGKEEYVRHFIMKFRVFRSIITLARRAKRIWKTTSDFRNLKLVREIPKFFRQYLRFKFSEGKVDSIYPILSDFKLDAGVVGGHYFHQDLRVAQLIYEDNPDRHIDVGSRIDGFVAHVASFREIEVFDIRPLANCAHSNIVFQQVDIMNQSELAFADSISCLHALEHFGLGRYGDDINPEGHLIGFRNLIQMLKAGGRLYVSFPIGNSDRVLFNAHRVFNPRSILDWVSEDLVLEFFDYVDDKGEFHSEEKLSDFSSSLNYGCGIYTFRKSI